LRIKDNSGNNSVYLSAAEGQKIH